MAKIKIKKSKKRGWLSQSLFTLSLVFLAFGLFLLGWAVWPSPRDAVQILIPSGALPAAPSGAAYTSQADYSVSLSWTRWIRSGREGDIQLSIVEAVDELNAQEVEREGQIIIVEPILMNLTLTPHGRVQTNLAPGKALNLSWNVTGNNTGEFPGKVYVAFGYYDDTLAEVVPVPVAVMDINIQVISLWGMGSALTIWLGFVGIVLWGMLFLLGRLAQARQNQGWDEGG